MKKRCRRLGIIGLCAVVFFSSYHINLVQAAKKDDLKQQNQEDQDKLDDLDDQVNELEDEQAGIDAEIQTLSNEIAELMASISLLEEEIEAKKAQIEQAKIDLAEAQKVEQAQYEAMKVRVKAMYESGDTTFLDIIFSSSSMQDMLNKADYIEKMHEYDKKMFTNYKIARQNVEDLKENLEIEESELEEAQEGLQEEMDSVEEARAELEAISEDYAVQISKARQQAEVYKSQIKQRNAQIKQIEAEEERKRKVSEYHQVHVLRRVEAVVRSHPARRPLSSGAQMIGLCMRVDTRYQIGIILRVMPLMRTDQISRRAPYLAICRPLAVHITAAEQC